MAYSSKMRISSQYDKGLFRLSYIDFNGSTHTKLYASWKKVRIKFTELVDSNNCDYIAVYELNEDTQKLISIREKYIKEQ